MHPTAERLYSAAKTLKNTEGQSAVARLLGELPQTVKNWETRGVSKKGAIKAQEHIGCSPVWLLSGIGSMAPGRAAEKGAVFTNPTEEDVELLANFRAMDDEDQAELAAEIAKRAERWRARTEKLMARLGMPVQKSAPAKAASLIARSSISASQKKADKNQ